jgi:hypothetical protein
MNLALGALIIVLLLLPALFFRIGINIINTTPGTSSPGIPNEKDNKEFSGQAIRKNLVTALSKLNFSEVVFFFSIIPVLLHLVSLLIIHLWGCEVDYGLLLNLFTAKQDVIKEIGANQFHYELNSFLLYIIVESFLALLLGYLLSKLIICFAGKILPLIIGDNIWFQLFTGHLLRKEDREKVDVILVDVLCSIKESSVIYTGLLRKFDIIRESNQLAYITIEDARSRDLRKEYITSSSVIADVVSNSGASTTTTNTHNDTRSSYSFDEGVMKKITPGKYFTIQGKDILNVNVTYYAFTRDQSDPKMIIGMEEIQGI